MWLYVRMCILAMAGLPALQNQQKQKMRWETVYFPLHLWSCRSESEKIMWKLFPVCFSTKILQEVYTTEHLKENSHTKNKYSE